MVSWAPGKKFTPIRLRLNTPPQKPRLPTTFRLRVLPSQLKKKATHSRHFAPEDLGLRRAIQTSNLKHMSHFLELGANPNSTYYSKTMLQLAIDSKASWDTVNILLNNEATPTSSTLAYAIKKNNLDAIKRLLVDMSPTRAHVKMAQRYGYTHLANILEKRVPPNVNALPPCRGPTVRYIPRSLMTLNEKARYQALQAVKQLGTCRFAKALRDDIRLKYGDGYFFAYDSSGTCIAGASVDINTPVANGTTAMHLRFLCSSKTCSGAGSFILKKIEGFALKYGMTYVALKGNYRAFGFYNKMKYSRGAGHAATQGNVRIATRARFAENGQFIKRLKGTK